MKLNVLLILLVVMLTGCATAPPQGRVADKPGAMPAVPEATKQKPAARKPLMIVSRIEPTPAVKRVIAQAGEARQQGHYDQALLLLDRAQRMAPKTGEVYLEMAKVNRQAGKLAKAEQLCLKALSLSRSDKKFRQQTLQELETVRRAGSS